MFHSDEIGPFGKKGVAWRTLWAYLQFSLLVLFLFLFGFVLFLLFVFFFLTGRVRAGIFLQFFFLLVLFFFVFLLAHVAAPWVSGCLIISAW